VTRAPDTAAGLTDGEGARCSGGLSTLDSPRGSTYPRQLQPCVQVGSIGPSKLAPLRSAVCGFMWSMRFERVVIGPSPRSSDGESARRLGRARKLKRNNSWRTYSGCDWPKSPGLELSLELRGTLELSGILGADRGLERAAMPIMPGPFPTPLASRWHFQSLSTSCTRMFELGSMHRERQHGRTCADAGFFLCGNLSCFNFGCEVRQLAL
jgi:hypothetical protein